MKLTQKLTTNDGELCHQYSRLMTRPGYADSVVIVKRILTIDVGYYINMYFKVLRRFRGKYLVEQIFAIKATTLRELNKFYNTSTK